MIVDKKAYFLECVKKAAKSLGLKVLPKVKVWDGACPYSENEIAHAHPDIGLICISRGKLESMSLDEIEETAFHETTHMLHKEHDTDFSTSMDNAQLFTWLEEHKPRNISSTSKKDKSKVDKERCNYHLCRKKTKLYRCKYCGNYFCKAHIKPKMFLTLHQVSTSKEPLRSILEKEFRRKDGHPDIPYTKIAWEKIEKEEKIKMEKFINFLDRLKKKEQEEIKEPEEPHEKLSKIKEPEPIPKKPINYLQIIIIATFSIALVVALLILVLHENLLEYADNLFPEEVELISNGIINYTIKNYSIEPIILNISHPMLLNNPIWNLPIKFYVNNSTCPINRIKDINYATRIWSLETSNLVVFNEMKNKDEASLVINCISGYINQTEENVYIIGLAGIKSFYEVNNFSIITEAEILLSSTLADCVKPVRILHEIGHILGFNHTDDTSSIMYPEESCTQKFTPEIVDTIRELYKCSLPDLYFSEAKATWSKEKLNLEIYISNRGTKISEPVDLSIETNNTLIYKGKLDPIPPGKILTIKVEDIKVRNKPENISIIIDPYLNLQEIDKNNNIVSLQQF